MHDVMMILAAIAARGDDRMKRAREAAEQIRRAVRAGADAALG